MSWTCKLASRKEVDEKYEKGEKVPIGWMWFVDLSHPEHIAEQFLSKYYKENNQVNRPPLLVQLPDGPWCMDGIASRDETKAGWTVTGEPPNITVKPSINSQAGFPDGYHGFLTGGVLTRDLEGRTYEEES